MVRTVRLAHLLQYCTETMGSLARSIVRNGVLYSYEDKYFDLASLPLRGHSVQ